MRRIRPLLADAPFRQPHALQDCLSEEQGKAPFELRPQVPAEHLFGSPGHRPFGRFESGSAMRPSENKTTDRQLIQLVSSMGRSIEADVLAHN